MAATGNLNLAFCLFDITNEPLEIYRLHVMLSIQNFISADSVFWYICDLFNDALSLSDHIML
jgi:hypothetical protein